MLMPVVSRELSGARAVVPFNRQSMSRRCSVPAKSQAFSPVRPDAAKMSQG